jgi:hypothetical protein
MRYRGNGEFVKRLSCPSSLDLLHRDSLPSSEAKELQSHLLECDFCSAEAFFLSRQVPREYVHSPAEMPAHLRALAEAILARAGCQFEELVCGPDC